MYKIGLYKLDAHAKSYRVCVYNEHTLQGAKDRAIAEVRAAHDNDKLHEAYAFVVDEEADHAGGDFVFVFIIDSKGKELYYE